MFFSYINFVYTLIGDFNDVPIYRRTRDFRYAAGDDDHTPNDETRGLSATLITLNDA